MILEPRYNIISCMNAENPRCAIEGIADKLPVPLVSVKGNELVFTTASYENPAFQVYTGIDSSSDANRERQLRTFIHDTCGICNLCSPRVFSPNGSDVRVERVGYSFEPNTNEIFPYESTTLRPEGKSRGRACVLDDHKELGLHLGQILVEHGFIADVFRTFSKTGADGVALGSSDFETMYFVDIILERAPDIVISDKGLGYFDGIDIIENIRIRTEDAVETVLLTGEEQTRETHKVARHFLTKPVTSEELTRILEPIT